MTGIQALCCSNALKRVLRCIPRLHQNCHRFHIGSHHHPLCQILLQMEARQTQQYTRHNTRHWIGNGLKLHSNALLVHTLKMLNTLANLAATESIRINRMRSYTKRSISHRPGWGKYQYNYASSHNLTRFRTCLQSSLRMLQNVGHTVNLLANGKQLKSSHGRHGRTKFRISCSSL